MPGLGVGVGLRGGEVSAVLMAFSFAHVFAGFFSVHVTDKGDGFAGEASGSLSTYLMHHRQNREGGCKLPGFVLAKKKKIRDMNVFIEAILFPFKISPQNTIYFATREHSPDPRTPQIISSLAQGHCAELEPSLAASKWPSPFLFKRQGLVGALDRGGMRLSTPRRAPRWG